MVNQSQKLKAREPDTLGRAGGVHAALSSETRSYCRHPAPPWLAAWRKSFNLFTITSQKHSCLFDREIVRERRRERKDLGYRNEWCYVHLVSQAKLLVSSRASSSSSSPVELPPSKRIPRPPTWLHLPVIILSSSPSSGLVSSLPPTLSNAHSV